MNESDKNKFFNDLAIEINFSDLADVKKVYYGLVRTLTKGLRKEEKIELPDMGKFSIHKRKARETVVVGSLERRKLPAIKTLKFVVDYKLKDYIKNLKD